MQDQDQQSKGTDIAGKTYWDQQWVESEIKMPADPNKPGRSNIYIRRLHDLLKTHIDVNSGKDKTLLEVGCGASAMLPYFAREFGLNISGIDYSEIGCKTAEEILRNVGIEGDVVCSDFFSPPEHMLGRFDYVVSFGVAEHFEPGEKCLSAFADFLRPEGKMITLIPNLSGGLGWLQRLADRKVYDIHVPHDLGSFCEAHEKAGLKIERAGYFLSSGFGLLGTSELDPNLLLTKLKKTFFRGLEGVSVLLWAIENKSFEMPKSKTFSPYIYVTARKN